MPAQRALLWQSPPLCLSTCDREEGSAPWRYDVRETIRTPAYVHPAPADLNVQLHEQLVACREFVMRIKCPDISSAEIHNKCGLGKNTDAPNIMAVAARLAADKAARAFEYLLPQIGKRVKHILKRVMDQSTAMALTSSQTSVPSTGAGPCSSRRIKHNACIGMLASSVRFTATASVSGGSMYAMPWQRSILSRWAVLNCSHTRLRKLKRYFLWHWCIERSA